MKFLFSLGSNVGDRLCMLRETVRLLNEAGLAVLKKSSIYEAEPWGNKNQDWFFNCCVEVETKFSPEELLKITKSIEEKLGRERKEHWGSRTIDIDLLSCDAVPHIQNADLILPHPHLHERRFVLLPLAEIAPQYAELLKACSDTSIVKLQKNIIL